MIHFITSFITLISTISKINGGVIRSSSGPLSTYGSVNSPIQNLYTTSSDSFVGSDVSSFIINSAPSPIIQILSSSFNPPGTLTGSNDFDYSFKTENGIMQKAAGTTKLIGDTEVVVMKGSYEYVGPDGQTYVVDWYADETGYHPSAPHLPQDVPIPYPEIADAVAAQIAFAAANLNDYDDGSYNGGEFINQDIYLTPNQIYSEDALTNYGSF
ncbi:cuticle protein 3 [Lepeophtheirus salmonis]|uniref:cuticle protein 3 n=1 Tax=Lepeophtheirus salmonis TaxID=72036 RepID=UPI001AE606E9|nr:endocuticle structural glycoprotein SgAbd-8-like isoform X2 [Lepeophtheirus salmonis]